MPVTASRLLLRFRLLAALALGALGVGCGPSAPPPDLLRLDSQLLPDLQLTPPDAAAASAELLASWPAASGAPLRLHRVQPLGDGGLRLTEAPEREAFALKASRILLLDAAPGELLRVEVEFEGLGPTRVIGGITSLPERLRAGDTRAGRSAQGLLRAVRDDARPLPTEVAGTVQLARALHRMPADHTQLAVMLKGSAEPARLLAVRVERLSLTEYLAEDLPRVHEIKPQAQVLSRALRLERDVRRGLRLDPDTIWRWRLPAHERAYRFEAALGLAPRHVALGGKLHLRVLADGATLLDRELSGSADLSVSAWTPLRAELPVGTRTLEVHASWPSGDGPLAMLAHPRLRRAELEAPPNLLVISLDTLRSDRLGAYGGPAPSAHLDAFAAQNLMFTRAYAPSAYTLPGHASLLSGQLPALHGARDLKDKVDAERTPLLAPNLAAQGYVTAAFTGGGFLSTSFGFGAGFDRFAHNDPCWPVDTQRGQQLLGLPDEGAYELALLQRSGVDQLAAWLHAQPPGAPFFALVHTYATHNYAPNQRWLERAGLLDDDGAERPFSHAESKAFHAGQLELRDAVYEQFAAHYDASIGMADDFVGTLLDALERSGHAQDTVVVITSDHGEELGEHDRFGHGRSLREGVTRVPLLVRVPGRAAARIEDSVSLADVAPWLLRLLGQPVDPRMQAPPALAPDTLDPPTRHTTLLDLGAGSIDLWALREGDHKLVFDAARDNWQLFDLASAQGEHRDVSSEEPEVLDALRHKLEGYRALAEAREAAGEGLLDPETRRQLAQLGYLDGDD
ncbi:MAG: hypothetical protein DHS20C15_32830 [Planctomycetota bacterium]|nr:MAG: hypothetical protein DHS20C15_32830 [Planctomycetota bacterium]